MRERDLVKGLCERRFLASIWLLHYILASYLTKSELGVPTSGENRKGENATGKVEGRRIDTFQSFPTVNNWVCGKSWV